jgi:CBS domain-containing protein
MEFDMKVRQIVQRTPVVVRPDETIQGAARVMAQEGVGTVLVADHGVLLGIVTDRDLVLRALATTTAPDLRIDSIMSMGVVTVEADADVSDAVQKFNHHAVRRLPVLDHGTIVGLVSVDELVVAFTSNLGEAIKGITAQLMFPHATDQPAVPVKAG